MAIFDFFQKFKPAKRQTAAVKAAKAEPPEQAAPPAEPYMSARYTYGNHIYRRAGEDPTVYYIDEAKGIRKMIVDDMGYIQDFPGIQEEDFWIQEVHPHYLRPQILFRTEFGHEDGRMIMRWQVQPDGRYWEDEDGFGMESDAQVILYAFLTEDGTFDGPFRVYKVGTHKYYPK